MDIQHNLDEGSCNVCLEGELTIYHVAELKSELLDMLDRCTQMNIHLDKISEIDTAGLQLLMLVKQESSRAQKHVFLIDHSPPVLELIDLFGLTAFFGDPVFIKSH